MPAATYDPISKLIVLDQIAPSGGVVNIDVQADLYSDAKEQWLSDLSLNRYRFPWRSIGGNPLPGGAVAPRIFFLLAPWKIRPFEADHQVTLAKNLFTEDGSALTVATQGNYTVLVNEVSDFSSGDDRLQLIINLLEADEEFGPSTARKLLRGTSTVLLQKTVTGGNLTGTIELKD